MRAIRTYMCFFQCKYQKKLIFVVFIGNLYFHKVAFGDHFNMYDEEKKTKNFL